MRVSPSIVALIAVLASVACTDEKIVFRDREPFNPPADAESGFLGYFTASTKETSCANCHVDHQRRWVQTAHSRFLQSPFIYQGLHSPLKVSSQRGESGPWVNPRAFSAQAGAPS